MDLCQKIRISKDALGIQTREISENRIELSFKGTINASPDKIFPLLCPKREEQWIDGWNTDAYQLISTKSGFNEKNCIFQENFLKNFLFGEEGPTTWITSVYKPEQFILEFLLVFGDLAVMNREVRLEESEGPATACRWTDRITSLKGSWNKSEGQGLEIQLKAFSYYLGVILKYYCETGKMLKLSALLEDREAIELPEEVRSHIRGLFLGI